MALVRSPHAGALAALGIAALLAIPAAQAGAHHDSLSAEQAERFREALSRHELRTLDGATLRLGRLQGEVVVVNFWASWCRPCRKELPALAALHAEIAGQGGRVVAVSIDEELANVKRFVRVHALALPVAHDGPEGLARTLDLDYVPFTVVLDRAGRVAYASEGSDAHAIAELGKVTRRLLGEAPMVSSGDGR
jgi:thiol-disulfide isomerase/thioredoxin